MRRLGFGLGFSSTYTLLENTVIPLLFDILGISENAILIFNPYTQVVSSFTGPIIRCVRSGDLAEEEFTFKNGVLDTASILSWCGGVDTFIKRVYLQNDNSKYAYQEDSSYMPKIVNAGAIVTEGLLYDGTDDVLVIDNYSALDIIAPKLVLYANYKRASSHVGFVFCKNGVGSDDAQYSILNDGTSVSAWWHGNERLIAANGEPSQDMIFWDTLVADGLKLNANGSESSALFDATLVNVNNVSIGARKNPTSHSTYFNGHIKSVYVFNADVYSKYTDLKNGGV